MSILIAIIILVTLYIIEHEDKENKKRPTIIGYNAVTGAPVFNKNSKIKPISYDIHTGKPIYEGEEEPKEVKKIKTEEDKRRITNSALMITGAVLIVFASIIFLATSWDVLPGIVKTLMLVVLQIVFYGFSIICDKTFDIQKTSKVFKYLSYIFVPIVLISLSCFEMVGDYFSISGDGYLLFFGICFLITDIIYKGIGYLTKDNNAFKMSYASEILAIFFIVLNFSQENTLSLLAISAYSFIFYLLLKFKVLDKEKYFNTHCIVGYFIVAILLFALSVDGETIPTNLSLLLFSIYYFMRYQYESDEYKQRRFIVYFLALYIASLTLLSNVEFPPYFLYIIALIPLLLLIKITKKETIKNIIIYGILILSIVITISSFANSHLNYIDRLYPFEIEKDNEIYYLLTYISGFILYVLTYLLAKKSLAKNLSYLAFSFIFMEIFSMVEMPELNKYVFLITIILVYALEVLFDKLKDDSSNIFIPGLIIVESVILQSNYAVLIPLLYMIAYIKIEKKPEALLIVPMLMSLSLFTMEKTVITQVISYILIVIYSLLSLNKKQFSIYTVVSFISIFVGYFAFEFHSIIFSALLLIWSASHLFFNRNNTFFKFATITSGLILYLNTIKTLDLDIAALYLIGFYLYLLAITRYLLNGKVRDVVFFECFGIAAITLLGLFICTTATDAVIIIFTLLTIIILAFVKKWNHMIYTGLICLVFNIIYLTWEYWSQIPWYIYILIVGLALIIFAMLDEKRKLNKKKEQEKIESKETEKDDMK